MIQNIPCRSMPMPYYITKPVGPDYSAMPLTLIANEDNTVVGIRKWDSPYDNSFQYSFDDGKTWMDYNNLGNNSTQGTTFTLSAGKRISFKGTTEHLNKNENGQFYRVEVTAGTAKVEGNIMSLVNYATTITDQYQFCSVFGHSDSHPFTNRITDASNLWLPDSITSYCYRRMFRANNGSNGFLSAGPIWRSTSTANRCYGEIFWGQPVTKIKFEATQWYNGCTFDGTTYNSVLSAVEVACMNSDMNSNSWGTWAGNSNGIFIRPYGSVATYCKGDWTVLERHSNGLLYYTNGTKYMGEDPFPNS